VTRQYGDASFLPIGEHGEPTTWVQERLNGQQISWLDFLAEKDHPEGWSGCALGLTSSAIMVVYAAPGDRQPYGARLIWRYLEAQTIWTRSMDRKFRRSRDEDTDVQRRVQGAVIRGVPTTKPPNERGGERARIELVGGGLLRIDALPGDGPGEADMDIQWLDTVDRLIILPGMRQN